MDRDSGINVAEKKRLRSSIEDQVRRFLANGGNITVVDPPSPQGQRRPGSAWHAGDDDAPVLD